MEQIAIGIANTPRMALAPSHVEALRAVATERTVRAGEMLLDAGTPMDVYAGAEGLSALVIENEVIGGQAGASSRIENYMGFPTGVSGGDLTWRGQIQAMRLGTRFVMPRSVTAIEPIAPDEEADASALANASEGSDTVSVDAVEPGTADRSRPNDWCLTLNDGERVRARSVVIATGVQYRRLPVDRLEEFEGAGVYYAATDIEARFCRNREVIIVGGGNSAGQAAMFISRAAKHVHILIRNEGLHETMSSYLSSRLDADPTITVHPFTEVRELHGEGTLDGVTIGNSVTGETTQIDAAGLFIMIGAQPNTGWLEGVVELNDKGFVPTGPTVGGDTPYATSAPGIFAVGDVRLGSVKRVASGVGEASVVISHVWNYVNGGVQP